MANGTLKVSNIQTSSGSGTITIGQSGETVTIPSGATITNSGTATGFGIDGITMADAFRLSADTNSGSNGDVTSNWERVDDPSFGGIGTGLTESSGIFSFPSTGIYLITWQAIFYVDAGDIVAELTFKTTNDNSSYNDDGYVYIGNGSGSNAYGTGGSSNIFDVTDTSNDKFKFRTGSMGGTTVLKGYTTSTQTGFSVIRLGDT